MNGRDTIAHACLFSVHNRICHRKLCNAIKMQSDWSRLVRGAGTTRCIALYQTLSLPFPLPLFPERESGCARLCQGGSMDIVKYLIEQMNCNASQVDERQVTPLHMAALYGHLHLHLHIVKYLIEGKLCNPLCRASDRNVPLHGAAYKGHLEVVQYYIQTIQCSPNIRGWHNTTPLEQARSNGHSHVVSYLESLSTK